LARFLFVLTDDICSYGIDVILIDRNTLPGFLGTESSDFCNLSIDTPQIGRKKKYQTIDF
jgi:hypothetical protein